MERTMEDGDWGETGECESYGWYEAAELVEYLGLVVHPES